jgi:hypothetical protein
MRVSGTPVAMITRHQEWLVLESWRVLHRISSIEPRDIEDGLPNGLGVAVCGASGHFIVPGLFSRMGLRRCSKCCDALGIPRGDGNTLNAGIEEPVAEPWEHLESLRAVWDEAA